jgi:vacuolar-type H+-ATPase subunit H
MLKSKSKPQKMRDQASEVIDRLAPHVESAREKAAPYVAQAREKATPLVESAREKATPAVDTAKQKFTTDVLPVMTAAIAAASEATEELREEAAKRGAATAAALKGEIEAPKKKTHKLRNFLIVVGLGGIAAFVAKRMSDREASTAWQSSYTPSPSGTGGTSTTPTYSAPGVSTPGTGDLDDTPMGTAAAAAAARTNDEGAAGPDEAVADAFEEPHPATTPENPLEETRIDEQRG